MDHDHVRERGCFDAAPVRPSEAHVPLVLQQPHQRKTHRTRTHPFPARDITELVTAILTTRIA